MNQVVSAIKGLKDQILVEHHIITVSFRLIQVREFGNSKSFASYQDTSKEESHNSQRVNKLWKENAVALRRCELLLEQDRHPKRGFIIVRLFDLVIVIKIITM